VHAQDAEGDPARRAFTLDELQDLFDYADDQVARVRAAGRKGWLGLFRDAALFKVAYAFGAAPHRDRDARHGRLRRQPARRRVR
jgi:integrase/recombinase XerC